MTWSHGLIDPLRRFSAAMTRVLTVAVVLIIVTHEYAGHVALPGAEVRAE